MWEAVSVPSARFTQFSLLTEESNHGNVDTEAFLLFALINM